MSSTVIFWVVWNPGNRNPTRRHASKADAEQEATRLARQNVGQEFFVLEALSVCSSPIPEVRWTTLYEEVPF